MSGVTDFDAYLAGNPLHTTNWPGNEWFADFGIHTTTMVLDLGDVYNVTRSAFWNEEHSGATRIQFFSCATAACAAPVALGGFGVVDSPFDVNYGAQVFDMADATTRYIMAIVDGPNVPNRFDAVSMAEIAFAVDATVPELEAKPLVGATMFGVTTPCVTRARERLEELGYEVLVFHATGAGGESLEALVRDGFLVGVLDTTTTELADELVGGVLSAGPDRLEAAGAAGVPQPAEGRRAPARRLLDVARRTGRAGRQRRDRVPERRAARRRAREGRAHGRARLAECLSLTRSSPRSPRCSRTTP